MKERLFFKVVRFDNATGIARGTHATRFRYAPSQLPRGRTPGAWMRVTGTLRRCKNGFHVTEHPNVWGSLDAAFRTYQDRVFLCEVKDVQPYDVVHSKTVARSMRLLREIRPRPTNTDWCVGGRDTVEWWALLRQIRRREAAR